MEHIVCKKVLFEKQRTIHKLLDITIKQEYTNLEEKLEKLRKKVNFIEPIFEENNVNKLSKCWSELLVETNGFIDFVLESYQDISKNIYL